jgi:hypothetical protein
MSAGAILLWSGDSGALSVSEQASTRSLRSSLPGVVGEQGDLDAVVELEPLEHA